MATDLGVGVVGESDFSLFDQTYSSLARELEFVFARHVLSPDEDAVFNTLMRALLKAPIIHCDGFTVRDLTERLTGEPGTSIFNGMWNLFWMYLTWVRSNKDPEIFFQNLNKVRVEGDDGLDGLNTDVALLQDTSRLLGLDLKFDLKPSLYHASFLGRWYGVDNNGVTRSMCDFLRTLKKYHLSARPRGPSTQVGLLCAKSMSYMATDSRTPVVSAVAWACMRITGVVHFPDEMMVFRERFNLRDISLQDIKSSPPPRFDQNLAATISYFTGFNIPDLRRQHAEWLAYGLGIGPQPLPLFELPKDSDALEVDY